jgi:hypothetical protein
LMLRERLSRMQTTICEGCGLYSRCTLTQGRPLCCVCDPSGLVWL